MNTPSWWPALEVLDLDNGVAHCVDVRVSVSIAKPRRRTRAAR